MEEQQCQFSSVFDVLTDVNKEQERRYKSIISSLSKKVPKNDAQNQTEVDLLQSHFYNMIIPQFDQEQYIEKENYELSLAELELERQEHHKTQRKLQDLVNKINDLQEELSSTKDNANTDAETAKKLISQFQRKHKQDSIELKKLSQILKDNDCVINRLKQELERRDAALCQLSETQNRSKSDQDRLINELSLEVEQERYLTRLHANQTEDQKSTNQNADSILRNSTINKCIRRKTCMRPLNPH